AFSDGVNQSYVGITVTDVAGNTSAATAGFTGINQDTAAPTFSESINSLAATGWYNTATGPAVITYTATDATSGVTTPAPYTFSGNIGRGSRTAPSRQNRAAPLRATRGPTNRDGL